MAKVYQRITDDLAAFIGAQPLFFVASAPLAANGHVNISPKGLDCLRILASDCVAYLDLTGSGNETSAHIAENGRVTLMFCAFSGAPSILRLYGRGTVVLPDTAEWPELRNLFPNHAGARQIISVAIERVQTSCGFAVPLMEFVEQRDTLLRWAENRSEEKLNEYRQEKNLFSIDHLPTPLAQQATADNQQALKP